MTHLSATSLPTAVRRALVIKLGHIGDVLVTTPVCTALTQAWPELEITVVVNRGTEAMLAHNPSVRRVVPLERDRRGLAGLAYQAGLVADLRRQRFDLCLELSGGDRGAWLAWFSGARHRVGFAPKKPHARARAFHRLVDQRGTQNHVVETFLRQPRALGIEPHDTSLVWRPGPEDLRWAEALLAEHGLAPGRYALLHPTSRWMFKTWTPEGNAALVAHLWSRGLPVVLSCAPDPVELEFNRRVLALLPDPPAGRLVDLSGGLNLSRLGALIGRAGLFLGVDSAPMHLAAAQKVPSVVLFGPSGEKMWGPWQTEARVITMSEEFPCRPCGRDGCESSKISRCLTQLPLERVTQAVDQLWAG